MKIFISTIIIICIFFTTRLNAQGKHEIKVKGTGFEINGQPFEYTGISFFNALYNPEFNSSSDKRMEYIKKFKEYGINVLRIWLQWDNIRGFVDSGEGKTLYNEDGSLKPELLKTLKSFISEADQEGVIILMALFARESWNDNVRLTDQASEKAAENLAKELKPYRNVVFQIWNEFDYRTIEYMEVIKAIDSNRLVTNSPGYGGDLGSIRENRALDFLSPHTSRYDDRYWEVAPKEISYLISKYNKPVVDDEPARRGTAESAKFGGPRSPTFPLDRILNSYNVWKVGGYIIYHHDMFQTPGSEDVPLNGIPLPGFSPYHDEVFEFLKNKERYLKLIR